jgi:hypothetical protein
MGRQFFHKQFEEQRLYGEEVAIRIVKTLGIGSTHSRESSVRRRRRVSVIGPMSSTLGGTGWQRAVELCGSTEAAVPG